MDWSDPPVIHNLFNVDLNLQMYGKYKKTKQTNIKKNNYKQINI